MSPIDGSLYLALGYQTASEVGGPASWYTCGRVSDIMPDGTVGTWDNHCRDTRNYIQTFDSLRVYRVLKSNGVPVYVGTRLNAGPTRMAVSEDGRELLFLYEEATTGGYTWSWKTTGPLQVSQTVDPPNATCTAVAMSIVPTAQGVSLGTSTQLSRETGPRCQMQGSQFNVPTFAPIRIAGPLQSR